MCINSLKPSGAYMRHWNCFIIGPDSDLSYFNITLQWRHNGRDSVSNHQPHDCLLNRLFRHRPKKTSKLRVTGLCAGNSPGTGEFPAQMVSYAENVSIWWRHHEAIIGTNVALSLIEPRGTCFNEISFETVCEEKCIWRKCIWIFRLQNGGHLVSTSKLFNDCGQCWLKVVKKRRLLSDIFQNIA